VLGDPIEVDLCQFHWSEPYLGRAWSAPVPGNGTFRDG
jgi:hypothetical protein